jgi:hypothetical protein
MITPTFDHLPAKLGALDRRAAHLERRLANPPHANYLGAPAEYDRAELEALRDAIRALEWFYRTSKGS